MAILTMLLTISPADLLGREIMSMTIPINNTIVDIVHAHPFPFHNPKAITRYATPSANDMAPVTTKTKPISGPIATDPMPIRRDITPAIMIKIAIIVTPNGLDCFCI